MKWQENRIASRRACAGAEQILYEGNVLWATNQFPPDPSATMKN